MEALHLAQTICLIATATGVGFLSWSAATQLRGLTKLLGSIKDMTQRLQGDLNALRTRVDGLETREKR